MLPKAALLGARINLSTAATVIGQVAAGRLSKQHFLSLNVSGVPPLSNGTYSVAAKPRRAGLEINLASKLSLNFIFLVLLVSLSS